MKKHLQNIVQTFMAFGLLVLLVSSCSYDTLPAPDVPEVVQFELDVIPIFTSNCSTSGCHDDGGISPVLTADKAWDNLINFNYVNTEDPPSSLLYTKIDGGSMETFASNQDRDIILKWIEQGALDD